jgi:hypothetical protein
VSTVTKSEMLKDTEVEVEGAISLGSTSADRPSSLEDMNNEST